MNSRQTLVHSTYVFYRICTTCGLIVKSKKTTHEKVYKYPRIAFLRAKFIRPNRRKNVFFDE